MREIFDARVGDWFLLENVNSKIKLEDDEGVDVYDKAKSKNTISSHFGSYILSHSESLISEVIKQKYDLNSKSIYYTDTDSLYIHKKNWSSLVDIGFAGKSLGLGKNG